MTPKEIGREASILTKKLGGTTLECQRAYTSAYNKAKRNRKSCKYPEAIAAYEKAQLDALSSGLTKSEAKNIAKVEYNKVYRSLNKDKLLQDAKSYREKNADQLKEYRQTIKSRKNEWERNKRKNDPLYSLACKRRTRRWLALKDITQTNNKLSANSFEKNFGCSKETLVEWLENLLPKDLTLESALKSGYHLDEIRPCSKFDFSDPLQITLCFDYRNCRIISKEENLKRYNIYTEKDEMLWIIHMRKHGYMGDVFPLFSNMEDGVNLAC